MIDMDGRLDNRPNAQSERYAADRGLEEAAGSRLTAAIRRLRGAGVDDPAGDARRLLAEALRGAPIDPTAKLPPHASARFARMIAARAARKPVAQIIGRRAFWRHDFEVTADVLDPRPESEALVEAALATGAADAAARVLDLGVGSGCLLLSVLADRPRWSGVGVDISAAALRVAARNAARLGLTERAAFVRGDWTDPIDARFNVVLCNPPYIGRDELAQLSPEVRRWEPTAALSPADGDALSAYRRVVAQLGATLSDDGAAFFEVGANAWADVAAIVEEAGFVSEARRDLGGALRVVVARRKEPRA